MSPIAIYSYMLEEKKYFDLVSKVKYLNLSLLQRGSSTPVEKKYVSEYNMVKNTSWSRQNSYLQACWRVEI